MSSQQRDVKEDAVAVKAEHYDGDQPTTEDKPAYLPTSDVRVRQKKPKDERRLVLKQDFVILPLLAGSIFFAYLDRSQIGNARVMGMQKDLGLSNSQFYNVLMMFFLGYMLIELPAGLFLRKFPPRYVIGFALISFGVIACCFAVAKTYATAMVLRLLIGLGEAFVNNAFIYISTWYKPDELALRTAAMYLMTPFSGAFGGLIAYGLQKSIDGALGYHAWQWLFILEGAFTILWGLIVVTFLPALPDTVADEGSFIFRHESERRIIAARLRAGQNTASPKPRYHQILVALKDPKLYLGSFMIGAQGIAIGAFTIFLPTFINEFGFSKLKTQLYSIIPYSFALATLISVSYLSSRLNNKGWPTFACLVTSMIGLIVLMATTNTVALVAGACFVLAGAYPALVISVAWMFTFHGGFTKRAVAVWFCQIVLQNESIVATQVYDSPPRFLKGHAISLAFFVVAAASTLILIFLLDHLNKKRDQLAREMEARGEVDERMAQSFEDLCDFHPAWRYSL